MSVVKHSYPFDSKKSMKLNKGKGVESENDDYDDAPPFCCSSRLGLAVMGFLGLLSMKTQTHCLAVAMKCMVNQTQFLNNSDTDFDSGTKYNLTSSLLGKARGETETREIICHGGLGSKRLFSQNITYPDYYFTGEFKWDEMEIDWMRLAFYWGYVASHIPFGWLGEKYGGKKILGICMLIASVSTALIPFAAKVHLYAILALRFIGGLGSGAAFPCMHSIIGRWAPPPERTKIANITYSGAIVGNVVTMPVSMTLCEYGLLGGWPFIFFIFGGVGALWSLMWIICMSETPHYHKRISNVEKAYIARTLSGQSRFKRAKKFRVPWGSILTSMPFYSIMLCSFSFEWGHHTMQENIPQFFRDILKFDHNSNFVISILPYVILWCLMLLSAVWADKLISRHVLKAGTVRKIMQLIGTAIPAAVFVGIGFFNCNQRLAAVTLLIVGMSFSGFQYSGFLVNHLDIAPKYAGLLMGITNGFGSIAPFVAPFVWRHLTVEKTQLQWQIVFLIGASIYVFGTLFYIIFGAGKVQKWAIETQKIKHVPETDSDVDYDDGGLYYTEDDFDDEDDEDDEEEDEEPELEVVSTDDEKTQIRYDKDSTDALHSDSDNDSEDIFVDAETGTLPGDELLNKSDTLAPAFTIGDTQINSSNHMNHLTPNTSHSNNLLPLNDSKSSLSKDSRLSDISRQNSGKSDRSRAANSVNSALKGSRSASNFPSSGQTSMNNSIYPDLDESIV